jgi:cytochrome b561
MQLLNTKAQYGAIPQLIHWLTALFVIAGWCLGQFGDFLPRGAPRATGLFIHMTLGQCVVALLIVRLLWRIANPPPPPEPTPLGRFVALAAQASHFTLYALLVVVPFLGIIVQLKRGHDLPVFGFWQFVSPWPADRDVSRTILRIHSFLADALLILAGVHACAALTHHWLWRDRTLTRMLPGTA